MKQAIARASCQSMPGWFARLFASFGGCRDARRRGRADMLSSHMQRDIGLHHAGLADDAHGDPLYGSVRRRL
jgi:hypothetical protein